MKTLAAFVLILIAGHALAADSRITDVTVYADRAQITRSAEVALNAGENRVTIAGLPDMLQDDSVRATGKASVPVTILDVQVKRDVHEKLSDDAAAKLEAELLALGDERAALDGRSRVLTQQWEVVRQIQIKSAGDVSRDIQINKFDVTQLKDLPAYIGGELTKLQDEMQKIAVARRELDRKTQAVQAEFNKRRASASRVEKTVLVTVNAKEATKLKLQVTYVIGNASWAPSYDARAATDAGSVELAYNATVRQQTGEDWTGVNLTLSTARPAVGASMPELQKWTLNFWEAMPVTASRLARFEAKGMQAADMAAPAPAEEMAVAAAVMPAQIEQGVTSASFKVPRAADVPSDGEPHRQGIAMQTLPASFTYEATPKLSPFAYLKATATNSTDAPFLAGAVNVFVGPDFVGTGHTETVAQGEALKLFLGIDEAVRLKREELKDVRGKSGFFNRRKSQAYGYKLTVENFKDKPQRVMLYEQIPVSANEEIKVNLGDTSEKPTKIDAPTGKLTWEFILKPREKREITYEFTVDWPQDRQVSGL